MNKSRNLVILVVLALSLGLLTVSVAFASGAGQGAGGNVNAVELGAVQNVPASGGVPCGGGGGVVGLIHDDGTFENGYSGNPATVSDYRNVSLFNPPGANYEYTRFCVGLVSLGGPDLSFDIVFYDDDGAGGTPGTLLGSAPVSANGIPGGLPCGWFEYDLTGVAGLPTGAAGDIYVGVAYNPMTYPSRFTCSDESGTTPLWPGYVNFNLAAWQATQTVFANYRAMAHRVEMALGAAIAMTKTVGLNPSACATTDNITIPAGYGGTTVTYCYEVTNTGGVTLTVHDLVDDQLGTILSGFPYVLSPSASAFLTVSAVITQTTVNSATWTASVVGGPSVSASDTATVTRLDPTGVSLSGFGGQSQAAVRPIWFGALLLLLVGFGLAVRRQKAA